MYRWERTEYKANQVWKNRNRYEYIVPFGAPTPAHLLMEGRVGDGRDGVEVEIVGANTTTTGIQPPQPSIGVGGVSGPIPPTPEIEVRGGDEGAAEDDDFDGAGSSDDDEDMN